MWFIPITAFNFNTAMKTYIVYLFAILLLGSCQQLTDHSGAPTDTEGDGTLILTFDYPDMESTEVKSLTPEQESAVKNLNLYLFHRRLSDVQHHFYTDNFTGSITLELPQGEYDLYALANAGTDLGKQTSAQISAYAVSITSPDDLERNAALLMSAMQTVSVGTSTQVAVSLVRAVTKVTLNLSVAPGVPVSLESVELLNAPRTMTLFTPNKPADAADCVDYEKQQATGTAMTATFYLLENAQGTVGSITDARQRSRQNAPAYASYFHIEGIAETAKVDFYVYPGENITDDFNIFRNKAYTMNAEIVGLNTEDMRISTTDFNIGAWDYPCYSPGQQATAILDFRSQNAQTGRYYLTCHLIDGTGNLTIDGISQPYETPVLLAVGTQDKSIPVVYKQNTQGTVLILFTLTDEYGYALTRSLSTRYETTKIFIQPSWEIAGNLQTYTEDGYTGTYRPIFSLKITATATGPVHSDIQVSMRLIYTLLSYNMVSNSKSKTLKNEMVTITIPRGATTATKAIQTLQGGCEGKNAAGAYKIIRSGYDLYDGVEFISASISKTDQADTNTYVEKLP